MTTEKATSATAEKENKRYELGIIMPSDLSEKEITEGLNHVKKEIASLGGEMVSEQAWGKRELAYRIQKYDTGFYFFLYFDMPASGAPELNNFCRLEKEIIRHLLVNRPEEVEIVDYSGVKSRAGEKPMALREADARKREEKEEKEVEIKKPAPKKTTSLPKMEEKVAPVAEKVEKSVAEVSETKEVKEVKKPTPEENSNKLDKILDDLNSDVF